jgi:hypothetical protein
MTLVCPKITPGNSVSGKATTVTKLMERKNDEQTYISFYAWKNLNVLPKCRQKTNNLQGRNNN